MTRSVPVETDPEVIIALIHGLQVDLSLLAAWLACQPEPTMQTGALEALAYLRADLARYAPPVQRH